MEYGPEYEKLIDRLKEISKKPEFREKYGDSIDNYVNEVVSQAKKYKREALKKGDLVNQEMREEVGIMTFSELKGWYENNPKGTSKDYRTQKRIAYYERCLDLLAEKFDVQVKVKQNNRIRNVKDLQEVLNTEPKARYFIELCNGNEVDVADILAVVYDGRIEREDVLKWLKDPSLREYLGKFTGSQTISDIEDSANNLLPLDKNNIIADIVYRRLIEHRRSKLTTKPSQEQRSQFLNDLESRLGELKDE